MAFPLGRHGISLLESSGPLTWSAYTRGSKMLHLKSPRGWAGLPCIWPVVDTLPCHLHLWPPSHRTCAFGHKRDCGRAHVQLYAVWTAMLANPVWYHPSHPGPSLCTPKVLTWRVQEAKMCQATRLAVTHTFHSQGISELEGSLKDHFHSPYLTEKGIQRHQITLPGSWHSWATRGGSGAQASSSLSRSTLAGAGWRWPSQHSTQCGPSTCLRSPGAHWGGRFRAPLQDCISIQEGWVSATCIWNRLPGQLTPQMCEHCWRRPYWFSFDPILPLFNRKLNCEHASLALIALCFFFSC